MSSVLKQTIALLSWLALTGCSHSPASDPLSVDPSVSPCQPLKALQCPPGLILPSEDQRYQLPKKPLSNGVMPPVDNRPPVQPLALLPGSEAYYSGNQAILQLEPTTNTQALWQQLKQCPAQLAVVTASLDERQQTLITGWINETVTDRARYRISLSQQAASPILVVQLVELQKKVKREHYRPAVKPAQQTMQTRPIYDKNGKLIAVTPPVGHSRTIQDLEEIRKRRYETHEFEKATPWPNQQRDYEILMLNRITTILEKQRTTLGKPTQAVPLPAGVR